MSFCLNWKCIWFCLLKKGWNNWTIIHLEQPIPCSECPGEVNHVCAVNGTTYENRCKAECVHAVVDCEGKCPCGKCCFTCH